MKKIIIMIGIIIILSGSFMALLNYDILMPLLFSSEKIGMYEITAVRKCRMNNDESLILIDNGIEIQLPLPNGAVEFENKTYPVREDCKQYLITTEAFQHYLHELLPQNGYEAEQMGAQITINNKDNSIKVIMLVHMFTRNFMRIEVMNILEK